jgi:hypothetical protein
MGRLTIKDWKVVIWAPEKGSSSGTWRVQSDRRRACLPVPDKMDFEARLKIIIGNQQLFILFEIAYLSV